ncbi:hypothetical protein SNE40_005889 [Patella caerulea]|uniref:Thyroglobulin type-1 domain-containing protein n=1 Tax=Patella caerulea TaxID=87958 RepID=A0AAN8Q583_PATCE
MRLLVALLIVLTINELCEARRLGKQNHHEKHREKSLQGHHHGNHHNGPAKLNIHRADGCNCPPNQMCVDGSSTGHPLCVTAEFIKEGKHLLEEFNAQRSKGFQLNDKEPKPHLYNRKHHKLHSNKPHNQHISVKVNPTKYESDDNRVQNTGHAKSKHNSGKKHKKTHTSITCSPDDMTEMRQRLTGWFRLLHAQDREDHPHHYHHGHHGHKKHRPHMSVKKELRNHHHQGHCKCLRSVMWEMRHLDQNRNHHLNQSELQEIERNNMEPCLRPYLDSCDHNKDSQLSKNEWCCCFSEVLPPCYKELRNLQEKILANEKNVFLPSCDHEGFYTKKQCQGHHHNSRICWCVDLNGNKIPNTETQGRAHCAELNALGLPKHS